jgi:hypothetical protein
MTNYLRTVVPMSFQKRLLKVWLRFECCLPMFVRSVFWNDWFLFGKPQLGYLETHLVDHCNLNCRRCSHFAPLAAPYFAVPEQFERDMCRLGELFRNIRVIRLMGGEPLLHPGIEYFFAATRKWFPEARLHLVTNGILLDKMADSFWNSCRQYRVIIDLTVYPPVRAFLEGIRQRCKSEQVVLRESPNSAFCVRMVLEGGSPQWVAFSNCRNMFYCPVLKDGRLYVCATSAYIGVFNSRYNKALPQDQGIALNTPSISGRFILRALNRAVELCRFCSLETRIVPWSNGSPEMADWDVRSVKEPWHMPNDSCV